MSNEFTYEYLPLRGITADTFRFYGVSTKINSDGKPIAVGFKYPNGSHKVRLLDEKKFYTEGDIAKAGLFGRDKFPAGGSRYVTVTEGEFDACSLYQVLKAPVVSVKSSVVAHGDCSADRAWLNSFERIYLAFDSDEPGRRAVAEVAKLFDYNKVFHVKFTNRKDANEYLQAGEEEVLKKIWWNSKPYLPEEIISDLDSFRDIINKQTSKGVPYPFPTLTEMTYGIRTGETVLITAQEKVGKTALMHAIEYQLLTETEDAIGSIFLEEDKKRHLQSLAGIHLKKPVHLPDSGVTDEQTFSAVQEIVKKDGRLHIYSHFGSSDPEVLLDHIRFLVTACSCRYILLDHLTMVVSGLSGEGERRALDYISTRLEMMVKELDFALIIVSHVNDEGKTRGSRNPTKVFDITINLDRNMLHENEAEKCAMYPTVFFNRFCHKTGPAGRIVFDPVTYTLTEDIFWNGNQPKKEAA